MALHLPNISLDWLTICQLLWNGLRGDYMFNEISTKQFAELIGNEKHRLVDVRPIDGYNGWVLEAERLGWANQGRKDFICLSVGRTKKTGSKSCGTRV